MHLILPSIILANNINLVRGKLLNKFEINPLLKQFKSEQANLAPSSLPTWRRVGSSAKDPSPPWKRGTKDQSKTSPLADTRVLSLTSHRSPECPSVQAHLTTPAAVARQDPSFRHGLKCNESVFNLK